ncbi:hypothetical protein BDP27DRAFT_1323944 [Rhodocollybia butyracea]|uniref:Uncharacterized protein n=1 Tax=Rhodocollybia butyracea TaxID=206335 RepID=A0A9P5PXN5_9AGAR|nr:hypothetical protein BDP27DRAFT_1323944 [Rhodocollybia butyracea]
MATILEPFDTPMLDYHADQDVQMHTNLDLWSHEEAPMEAEDTTFSLTRSSSAGELVDVEIEMENYLDEASQNPEYEMVEATDYSVAVPPEDIVVMDASHNPSHTLGGSALNSPAAHAQTEEMSHLPPVIDSESAIISSPLPIDAETIASAEPHSLELPVSPETFIHSSDPISETSVSANDASEPNVTVPATVSDLTQPLSVNIPADESSASVHAEAALFEPEHVSSASVDPPVTYLEGDSSETDVRDAAQTEETLETGTSHSTEEHAAGLVEALAGAVDEHESVASIEAAPGEIPVEASTEQTEAEERGVSESDPHEISDGVYIDPPPAVVLSFGFLDHPDVCLFNQPSLFDPSSSTSDPSSYAILLADQPTLYYEPLSTLFDALRNDKELSGVTDLSYAELVLNAYDLQLSVSEDNIFARETSLHDLNVLHDGSDLYGPLRLRLQLLNPRFIVRYRMLQDQISRLNLAEAGEEYVAEELNDNSLQETLEQEHGPEYIEGSGEDFTQEQDGENNLQTEEPAENDSHSTELDTTNQTELDASHESAIPDGENVQPELYDAAPEPQAPYDDAQEQEQEQEQESEENLEPTVNGDTDPVSAEEHDVRTHDDDEGHEGSIMPAAEQLQSYLDFPAQEVTETSNDALLEAEGGSHESEYEIIESTGIETLTEHDTLAEPHFETESHTTEEPYQGEDLYYDENADVDAEWDGTEYDEVADATFDTEGDAEHESESVQSSVTLSSRNSKRSIQEVDEDDEDRNDGSPSVQSSPGSKRARTE